MQVAVELSPQDAVAHSNLGVTLKDLGRLDEAEASLGQAIALMPASELSLVQGLLQLRLACRGL